jgi:uncharacterized 2Fe-2S/4Fe-4S cluster protein (DUF4445 family)
VARLRYVHCLPPVRVDFLQGQGMTMRHPYVPSVSFGNLLTMATMAIGGIGALVVFMSQVSKAEEKIEHNKASIVAVEERAVKRIEKLEGKIEKLSEQQAAMNANLAILMRSQGLRPVEAGQ